MLEEKTGGVVTLVGLLQRMMTFVAEEEDVICLLFWL